MLVKFWGVRGSTPTPQAENLRYGGNTSCVEVRVGDQIYIFDCGTGFRVLGHELETEFGDRPFAAHVTLVRRISRPIPREAIEPIAWRVNDFALVVSDTGKGSYEVKTLTPLIGSPPPRG